MLEGKFGHFWGGFPGTLPLFHTAVQRPTPRQRTHFRSEHYVQRPSPRSDDRGYRLLDIGRKPVSNLVTAGTVPKWFPIQSCPPEGCLPQEVGIQAPLIISWISWGWHPSIPANFAFPKVLAFFGGKKMSAQNHQAIDPVCTSFFKLIGHLCALPCTGVMAGELTSPSVLPTRSIQLLRGSQPPPSHDLPPAFPRGPHLIPATSPSTARTCSAASPTSARTTPRCRRGSPALRLAALGPVNQEALPCHVCGFSLVSMPPPSPQGNCRIPGTCRVPMWGGGVE